jgi:two-component system sensor histidine kinase KdpD
MRAYQKVVRDLEQSKSELQDALRAKDEFLALVSHELRTPVAIIFGNLELMTKHRDKLTEDDQKASRSDLRSEAARLRRLVENVLAMARVEYGVKNEPEPISLSAIVKQQVERHSQMYPERPITAQVTADLPPVASDELSVELVLGNLLANAQKYSPADQPIEITVAVDDSSAVVSVHDRGPGVPVEDLERIFDPFYRSESSGSVKGVGIGLAVCKRLVEAHDGRVWVTPHEEGGSDFSFSLPLALEPRTAEVAAPRAVG